MTYDYDHTLARSRLYEYLSVAFLYPEDSVAELLHAETPRMPEVTKAVRVPDCASSFDSIAEFLKGLGVSSLQKEHLRVFSHIISAECPPYEGEYNQPHIFQKADNLADIASFYKAFGLQQAPEALDRLDHISVELEFMHVLTLKEAYAISHHHGEDKVLLCRQAQESFLEQHLGLWAGAFGQRLQKKAGATFYGHLAAILEAFIQRELKAFSLDVAPSPVTMPLYSADDEPDCDGCPLTEAVGQGGDLR